MHLNPKLNSELSLEQKFKLRVLKQEIKTLSKEQSQEFLLESFKQLMIKDMWISQILKERY